MRNQGTIVATLGSTQTLAWASSYYLPAVLAAPLARDIHLTPAWVYAGLSLGLGVSALLGPVLGRTIDRHGGRFVLCGSNIAFAIGLSLLSISSGPLSLLGSWLILGVAMAAGLYEPAFAAITRLYGYESRAPITGITLIAGFASTVGWPVSAFLEHRFGWREACLVWAALHVVVGLPLNAWVLRKEPRALEGSTEPPNHARGVGADRRMVVLMFMFTVSGIVSIGMATNLPGLFVAIGATPVAAIAAASLMGPAQVGARVLEYSARKFINPLVSARIACSLHPLGALAIAAAGPAAASAFAIIHGAGNGMLTITRGTLPLALFGPEGYGARIGRISAPARIGQAAGPFLFGITVSHFGVRALLISSGLSLLAFVSLYRLALPPIGAGKRSAL
jgi:MFS family permease